MKPQQRTRRAPIVVTVGDPRGIGPEVLSKALLKIIQEKPTLLSSGLVILGPAKWFSRRLRHENIYFEALPSYAQASLSSKAAGKYCGQAIELAALECLRGKYRGVVTGPIDKTALNAGGYHYNGHTDMLADICNKNGFPLPRPETMMLANSFLRVSLVTTHIPLKDVSKNLTQIKIIHTIQNTVQGLQEVYGIKSPRLAVLGLNPHCGDNGLFGDEEIKVISPALSKIKRNFAKSHHDVTIDGPFSSDGFFPRFHPTRERKGHSSRKMPYDAVIALYHDQGLIPVKLLDFSHSVNITLGLPLMRTSVDHGVAFDIAGKNQADPSSFHAALTLALEFKGFSS